MQRAILGEHLLWQQISYNLQLMCYGLFVIAVPVLSEQLFAKAALVCRGTTADSSIRSERLKSNSFKPQRTINTDSLIRSPMLHLATARSTHRECALVRIECVARHALVAERARRRHERTARNVRLELAPCGAGVAAPLEVRAAAASANTPTQVNIHACMWHKCTSWHARTAAWRRRAQPSALLFLEQADGEHRTLSTRHFVGYL